MECFVVIFSFLSLEMLPSICFTESKWLFFVQWFVAIETGHYFARYRLGNFSSSLLHYKIILKRHRSVGNESSFARQLSHERFVVLAESLLSLEVRRVLLPKLRTRILWVINTWPYERRLSRGSPGTWEPKILPGFLPLLPSDVALGLGDPILSRNKSLFSFFLSDLHKCGGTGNNLLLKSLSHSPYHLTLLPKCRGWWEAWTSSFATCPSPLLA